MRSYGYLRQLPFTSRRKIGNFPYVACHKSKDIVTTFLITAASTVIG